jgi:hypothetical protein
MNQLRKARSLTRTSLADLLETPQGGISRLERRTDMYVSTLRGYIRAMGAGSGLPTVFSEWDGEISQFQDLERKSR